MLPYNFFRTNAFRNVRHVLKFGRLSRSSSIEDDQKSLMGSGTCRSSGLEDSSEALSTDVEAGFNDLEGEGDDLGLTTGPENDKDRKKPPR